MKASETYKLQHEAEYAEERAHEVFEARAASVWHRTPPLGMSHLEWVDSAPEVQTAKANARTLRQQVRDAQTEIGGIVFCVAEENLPKVEKKLATLNRKAEKIGTEPLKLTYTDETEIQSYTTDRYSTHPLSFVHRFVILSGATPKIEGFTIVADLAHTDAGTLVHRIPLMMLGDEPIYSEIDVEPYAARGPVCDHCHKDIKTRKDTFVILNDQTGEIKQIGRSCLKDFTGGHNPEAMVKWMESVWDWFRHASAKGETPSILTRDFLAHASALSRDGYHKGMKWEVRENYWDLVRDTRHQGQPTYVTPSEADYTLADTTIAWGRAMVPQNNDFMENIRKSLSVDVVAERTEGFLAYAPTAYLKEQSRLVAEAKEDRGEPDFIGVEGQRIERTFKVEMVRTHRSDYTPSGDAPLYILADEYGNPAKWFASNWNTNMEVGGEYVLKATVKKHDTHERFGKSTVLTRVRVERTVSEPVHA